MSPLRLSSLAFVLVLVLAPLSVAEAGSCPTCAASSECTNPEGGPAFCVVHDDPVGCGELVTLCCPGQGCAISGGRPSCEAAGTCTVIEDADPDAGAIDAGAIDAGGSGADTGGSDGGVSGTDAGAGMDAGGPTPGGSSCGCRTGERDASPAMLAGLGAIAIALARRRRALRPLGSP